MAEKRAASEHESAVMKLEIAAIDVRIRHARADHLAQRPPQRHKARKWGRVRARAPLAPSRGAAGSGATPLASGLNPRSEAARGYSPRAV